MLRRLLAAGALVAATLLALAAPAAAHVEVEPAEAVAGATQALTFSVAFEGAATTGLEVQLPEGASVSDVPPKAGWTSAVDEAAGTVSWSGGPAPQAETFTVTVVLPSTPGEVLFPAIQRTTEGEVAWIGEEPGEGHDTNPAPRLTLVADPAAGTTTTAPSATTTTAAPTTTEDELPATTVEAEERDDGSNDAAPWLIGSAVVALAAILVGGLLLKRRADREAAAGAEAPAAAGPSAGDGDLDEPGPGDATDR
jgi:uncharacterized protein YcnI